jgi:hypothetical protein
MLTKKLNDVLENIMKAINVAQPIILGGEFLEKIDLGTAYGNVLLSITEDKEVYNFEYKLKEEDGEEEIIRGLIDEIYKIQLIPRKNNIKKAKKYLKRKIEGIYKCEYKLENLRNNQNYDLVKKSQLLAEEDVINHEIFIKYRELDDAKVDMEQFNIYKNILFQSLKELKMAA